MIKRKWYPMKHSWDTTMRIGEITPIFRQEVTPLDRWSGQSIQLGRMSPMNKPVFGKFDFETYWFFVPYQMVWNAEEAPSDTGEFADYIGPRDDVPAATWPGFSHGTKKGAASKTLAHFFGCGLVGTTQANYALNTLPIYQYNHICNHYFHDELIGSKTVLSQGSLRLAPMRKKSILQKITDDIERGAEVTIDTSGSTLGVTNITDAIEEQDWAEMRERYGDEYDDVLRMMGVRTGKRFNNAPELIGFSRTPIGISEVLNTSNTNTGEYVGHGIVTSRMNLRKKMFKEWGTIIGLALIRPNYCFKNKIEKWWNIPNEDEPRQWFYNPQFARMSHEVVRSHEIHSTANAATRDAVAGYVPKYQWLRQAEDVVAGDYLTLDTYDPQIMVREGTNDAVAINMMEASIIDPDDFQYLFQSSTEPHLFVKAQHSIGKLSQVPPAKVQYTGEG